MNGTIPLLLIGKTPDESDLADIEALEAFSSGRLRFDRYGPALEEVDVLDAVERIADTEPPALVIDALQGNSARAIVLAAVKARVPVAIWCHDGKHSLASSSIAAGALQQLGLPYILVHGGMERAAKELETAVAAASAIKRLRSARIGQLGSLHRNLVNAAVNPLAVASRFGAWTVPLSVDELKTQMAAVCAERIDRELAELKLRYIVEAGDALMRRAVALRLALTEMACNNRLDAVAVGCWSEIVPELGVNPCLEFACGELTIACEGDVALALALLAGRKISGGAGYCGDFYSFDEEDGTASLMHCAGCAGLHGGREPMRIGAQPPPNTQARHCELAVARPELAPGLGVILLLHGANLEALHLRKCEILGSDFSNQMQAFVRIEGDCAGFRREAAGNHYVLFPGQCHDAWELWARWSGVGVH